MWEEKRNRLERRQREWVGRRDEPWSHPGVEPASLPPKAEEGQSSFGQVKACTSIYALSAYFRTNL